MMGFKDFMDDEELQEGRLIRKGLGLLYSRQSKSYGDKSVQHFNRVKQELSKPVPDGNLDQRLNNLEKGFIELSEGMVQLRNQIGSLVSMVNISILLSERTDQQMKRLKKS
ncbi:hypothetical protein N8Y93_01530 [Litorivicinus sp.]|nr:hypothetical protein [Litorivicinus sp.]